MGGGAGGGASSRLLLSLASTLRAMSSISWSATSSYRLLCLGGEVGWEFEDSPFRWSSSRSIGSLCGPMEDFIALYVLSFSSLSRSEE